MKRPEILISNDDGIFGPGLHPLIDALRSVGHVTVCVPDQERSADSHSLTLHKPLRLREVSRDFFIANGGPSDCARFGVLEILKGRVDLLVSGINNGYNLGEDVIYSGTVAAAMEGTLLRVPSFAISQGLGGKSFSAAAFFARKLARRVLRYGLPQGVAINVNVPPGAKVGVSGIVARLGRRVYGNKIMMREDPRGHKYFWLAGKEVTSIALPGSDVEAINEKKISMTPLHLDNTDFASLAILKQWKL